MARNTRLIQATEALHARLDGIATKLNANSIQNSSAKFEAATSARKAATIAARGQFDSDPLPDAPLAQAWRLLYKQAEAFNAELYPGSTFPETGADRVCLLCQQPYSASASERMARFRSFLEDTSQRESSRRERELAEDIQAIKGISIPTAQDIELPLAQISEIRQNGNSLINKVKATAIALSTARSRLLDCLSGLAKFTSLSETDPSVLADLDAMSSSLEEESSSLSQQNPGLYNIDDIDRTAQRTSGSKRVPRQ